MMNMINTIRMIIGVPVLIVAVIFTLCAFVFNIVAERILGDDNTCLIQIVVNKFTGNSNGGNII